MASLSSKKDFEIFILVKLSHIIGWQHIQFKLELISQDFLMRKAMY